MGVRSPARRLDAGRSRQHLMPRPARCAPFFGETMNKAMIDQMWDQFRQKYGVYLRVLEAIPADRYATHPVAGMRTPAELAVHISSTCVRDMAEGVAKGRIT